MGWQTPESYLELVRKVGPILFDPCTVSSNPTKAAYYVPHDKGANALAFLVSWAKHVQSFRLQGHQGLTFVNPPYGDALPGWTEKVLEETAQGLEVVFLVPARPDTRWHNRALHEADCTLFHGKRIQFLDAATGKPRMTQCKKTGKWTKNSAAFPSSTFYFGPNVDKFRAAFAGQGTFVKVLG
jgi:hypothetical protein